MFGVRTIVIALGFLSLTVCAPVDPANAYQTRSWRRHAQTSHGRPTRWCGWWMRTQKGGGPEMSLASNWRHGDVRRDHK
jgi:hypothetical protein